MLLHAFTLYDSKALVYHTPFFAVNTAAAVRSVTDLAADTNTMVGRHPSDFVLYQCGTYDDARGLLTATSPLTHVIDVSSCVPIERQFVFTEAKGETV